MVAQASEWNSKAHCGDYRTLRHISKTLQRKELRKRSYEKFRERNVCRKDRIINEDPEQILYVIFFLAWPLDHPSFSEIFKIVYAFSKMIILIILGLDTRLHLMQWFFHNAAIARNTIEKAWLESKEKQRHHVMLSWAALVLGVMSNIFKKAIRSSEQQRLYQKVCRAWAELEFMTTNGEPHSRESNHRSRYDTPWNVACTDIRFWRYWTSTTIKSNPTSYKIL